MFWQLLVWSALAVWIYMTGLFIVALLLKNNSIADVGWGTGFVIASWVAWLQSSRGLAATTAMVLVLLWGGRLSWHILKRNAGQPEDWRYANWRKEWGKWFIIRSYLQVFLMQGVLLLVIVAPVIWIMGSSAEIIKLLARLGMIIWITGYLFEVIGDAQLRDWLANRQPSETVCDVGLWRLTRHPNYFGEATLWWGMFLLALSVSAPWWLIVGPLTITILVRFVSGVPLLEKKMMQKAHYRAYARRTNIFFPMPPKKP